MHRPWSCLAAHPTESVRILVTMECLNIISVYLRVSQWQKDWIAAIWTRFFHQQDQKQLLQDWDLLGNTQQFLSHFLMHRLLPLNAKSENTGNNKSTMITKSRPISIIGLREVQLCNKGIALRMKTLSPVEPSSVSRTPLTG